MKSEDKAKQSQEINQQYLTLCAEMKDSELRLEDFIRQKKAAIVELSKKMAELNATKCEDDGVAVADSEASAS